MIDGEVIDAACPESRHVRSRIVTGKHGPKIELECRSNNKPYSWLKGTVGISEADYSDRNSRKIYFTDPRGCPMNTTAAINFD